jgi:site-specific recombinase XerD
MLSVLYDTGARVQELVDLKVRDVRLDPPPILTLTGKGRKTRQVPLMSNTESLLRQYMIENCLLQNGMQDRPLFVNHQYCKLTTEGIKFILNKYASSARTASSIIPDKVTPHVLRHYGESSKMVSVDRNSAKLLTYPSIHSPFDHCLLMELR